VDRTDRQHRHRGDADAAIVGERRRQQVDERARDHRREDRVPGEDAAGVGGGTEQLGSRPQGGDQERFSLEDTPGEFPEDRPVHEPAGVGRDPFDPVPVVVGIVQGQHHVLATEYGRERNQPEDDQQDERAEDRACRERREVPREERFEAPAIQIQSYVGDRLPRTARRLLDRLVGFRGSVPIKCCPDRVGIREPVGVAVVGLDGDPPGDDFAELTRVEGNVFVLPGVLAAVDREEFAEIVLEPGAIGHEVGDRRRHVGHHLTRPHTRGKIHRVRGVPGGPHSIGAPKLEDGSRWRIQEVRSPRSISEILGRPVVSRGDGRARSRRGSVSSGVLVPRVAPVPCVLLLTVVSLAFLHLPLPVVVA